MIGRYCVAYCLYCDYHRETASVPTDVMEKSQIEELWQALTNWLTVLNQLSEIFSGETLMNRIDKLQLLEHNISGWDEIALSILQRRVQYSVTLQGDAPVGAKDAQKESVTALMSDVNSCMKALSLRTSGENGKFTYLLIAKLFSLVFPY